MASVCKKCRCGRERWEECPHAWFIRWRVRGREVYRNVGYDRKAADRSLKTLNSATEETVSQALDAWIASKEAQPGARFNSIAAYRTRAVHVRDYFGATLVRLVRPEHLTAFCQGQLAAGRSPATVQAIYATLTASLRHAQRRGVISALPLPLDGPGIPQPLAREHNLTLAQVEAVIARLPGVWGQVGELAFLTGLRWGEIVAIERSDIDGNILRVARALDDPMKEAVAYTLRRLFQCRPPGALLVLLD